MNSLLGKMKQSSLPNRAVNVFQTKLRNVGILTKLFWGRELAPSDYWLLPIDFQRQVRTLTNSPRFHQSVLPQAMIVPQQSGVSERTPPSTEELNWIAGALAQEKHTLEVLNADSWNEVLLILVGGGTKLQLAETFENLLPEAKAAYKKWCEIRSKTEHRLSLVLPTHQQVRALFRLLLGRDPFVSDNIDQRAQAGTRKLIESLLLSSEFRNGYIRWVESGKPVHDGQSGMIVEDCRQALFPDILPNLKPNNFAIRTETWGDFLQDIWFDDDNCKEILSALNKNGAETEFIKSLIDAHRSSVKQKGRVRPVLAYFNKGLISLTIDNAYKTKTADATISLEGVEVEQVALQPGRNQDLLSLPKNLTSRLSVNSNVELTVKVGKTESSIPVLKRPIEASESTECTQKIFWTWRKGTHRRTRELMDQNAHAIAPLVRYVAECFIKKAGYPEDDLHEWLRFEPEWQSFQSRYSERSLRELDLVTLFGDLNRLTEHSDDSHKQTESKVLRAAQEYVHAHLSHGAQQSLTFESILDEATAKNPKALSLLMLLATITLPPDEDLERIAIAVHSLKEKDTLSLFTKLQSDVTVFGLVDISRLMAPQLVGMSDFAEGSAAYCEASGDVNVALELVEPILARYGESDVSKLVWAGTLHQKFGEPEKASEFFEKALKKQPRDMKLLERYLDSERRLLTADPLRLSPDFEKNASRFSRRLTQALLDNPDSAPIKSRVAKALVIGGNVELARDYLLNMWEADTATNQDRIQLLDLCVKANRNDEAIKVYDSIEGGVSSEWAIINKARALRALGRPEEAGEHLNSHAAKELRNVSREAIRNEFFLGRFEAAAERGDRLLTTNGEDVELAIVTAAAHLELQNAAQAREIIDRAAMLPGAARFRDEICLFQYSIAKRLGEPNAVENLDEMFVRMGCAPVRLKKGASGNFDDFIGGPPAHNSDKSSTKYSPVTSGPLVSVIMTSFNSEEYIETAINSILEQSYQNLELIISDDASTDSTPNILRRYRDTDARVKIILNTENRGTYVAKNKGLLSARGKYVALQDSDDWSHPDRIGKSVSVLESRRDLIGLTTDWLRMTNDGRLMVKAGGQISHVCCISLVMRREACLDSVGYFDSVRIEADMEYIRRLQLKFGKTAVARLRWPLLFGRARSDSLTGNEEYGISRTGFSEPRLLYQAAQAEWHGKIETGASAFMPFPLEDRRFEAPDIILPIRGDKEN